MLLIGITAAALVIGLLLPVRWKLGGYLSAVAALFALQAGINTAMGFEGTSIEDSLLLFNGSWVSYLGFNLQITYRAFVLPLLAITIPVIFRATRA